MTPFVLALLAACGTTPDAAHDHEHGHDHGEHADHTHPPAATPAADPHAGHHAGGSDHMGQMAATREALRKELGAAYDAPVEGLATADAVKGKATYDAHCASCHGAGGKGDGEAGKGLVPPPADFTDAFHARYYSDAGRVQLIRKGSPDTAMVGFEGTLDPQGILDVYAFVRTMRESGAPAPAAPHDHGDGAHAH